LKKYCKRYKIISYYNILSGFRNGDVFMNKKFQKMTAIIILLLVVAMVATMVLPYLAV